MAESKAAAVGTAAPAPAPAAKAQQPVIPHDSREFALHLHSQDPLRHLRDEFLIPSKADLASETLPQHGELDHHDNNSNGRKVTPESHDPSVYLCGNSLGLQPRRVSARIRQFLSTWATQGVLGHFKPLSDSPLPVWLHADEAAAKAMAPVVGADKEEIAIMETLTANLHFILSAFYTPDPNGRHKIILESKAFPSDHFAVESQIRHHNLDPAKSMVTIEPDTQSPTYPLLSTEHILSIISEHAADTAVLLLPGIQYYSGQLFDIKTITAHAQSLGIFVVWDLAHAVGNVPLQLHDWNVDAAAWCNYKYLNSGPGAIGGLFVHSRHSQVSSAGFHNRLSGWWGSDKKTRFEMNNHFQPISGAGGFQVSNPSSNDLTVVCASLEVFALTSMAALREKSLKLTAYLEERLVAIQGQGGQFKIITPRDPAQRGAQLSLQLEEGLLGVVMRELQSHGVIVDERMPDVIRVAPAPLYNSFVDVWDFTELFGDALKVAQEAKERGGAQPNGVVERVLTT